MKGLKVDQKNGRFEGQAKDFKVSYLLWAFQMMLVFWHVS
jgi:hypothetical protein